MLFYIPYATTYWGDNITAVWIAEYLKEKLNCTIIFNSMGCENPEKNTCEFNHGEYIKLKSDMNCPFPWNDPWKRFNVGYDYKIENYLIDQCDKVIATHHRHGVSPRIYDRFDPNKLTYFDAHGLIFKFVTENWYPTLEPTDRLLSDFNKLNLEKDNYFVIHVNDCVDRSNRNSMLAQEYFAKNKDYILKLANGRRLISTTKNIFSGSEDFSDLYGWLKIYLMYNSYGMISSQTGFSSIAAMYRKRRNTYLVNEIYPACFNLGPPNICYGNYDVYNAGSLDKLYYAAENNIIPNSSGLTYKARCEEKWRNWLQYETFEFNCDDIRLPADYKRKSYYDNIDNCLVPFDAKYKKDDDDKLWDYRTDDSMVELAMMSWNKRIK